MAQWIDPSQFIPLTYELPDGTAAPTRYVQSKILKASNRSVLATVNLTNNGSGDFSNYSKTPNSINAALNSYIEVITTVYKDAAYADPDTLRYTVKKDVYYIKEDRGGAILGGRQVQQPVAQKAKEIDLDELVEKIFKFNKLEDIKDKNSFAKIFLSMITDLGVSFEGVNENLVSTAEMITSSNKQVKQEVIKVPEACRNALGQKFNDLSVKINNLSKLDKTIELNDIQAFIRQQKEFIDKQLININKDLTKLDTIRERLDLVSDKQDIKDLLFVIKKAAIRNAATQALDLIKELNLDKEIGKKLVDFRIDLEEFIKQTDDEIKINNYNT